MGNETSIQWTQKTWNPAHGCHKISDGCKFCYMYRDKERYGQDPNTVVRSKSTFYAPLKWKDPALVFTCSWSDWFIEEIDEWRDEMWSIVKKTPHLTYQILTKRPERIADHLPEDWGETGYANVWLGVSIESDKHKDRLITLHENKTNKSKFKTFVSAEPLLSSIDFSDGMVLAHEFSQLDWLIIGGESGNTNGKYKYRECELDWIYDLIAQGKNAGVPVFMKQVGTYLAKQMKLKNTHGGDITEFPIDLQVREMPQSVERKLESEFQQL